MYYYSCFWRLSKEKSAERVAKLETQNKQLSDDDEKTKKIEQLEASLAKMWATEPKEEGDLGEKLASDFEWWGQVIDKKFKSLAIEAPPEQDGKEEELILSLKYGPSFLFLTWPENTLPTLRRTKMRGN